MFSNTAPHFPFSWNSTSHTRPDVTGLDLVVITATRIIAILSCYHQLQCVRRIGLRKILYFTLVLSSITSLLFVVLVGLLFKNSSVNIVDLLPFIFLLLDVPKTVSFAKLVFVAESTSRYSYRLAIATTFQKLGPITFLDFTVAVLVFAMGLILDLRYLQFVCFLSLLCVFSLYFCFVAIYPSLLCLFAEVCLYGASGVGKAREFILECGDINCDFMYRSNSVVVKLKALISVGLLLVHTMNYLLNPCGSPYQAIKTTIGSNQPQYQSTQSSTLLLTDPETVNLLYGYSVGTEHVILAILAAALAVRFLIGEFHQPSDGRLLERNSPGSQQQGETPGIPSTSAPGDMTDGGNSTQLNEGPVYTRTVSWSSGGAMDDVRSFVECSEILANEGTEGLSNLEIVMLMKCKKIPGHSLEKMMEPLRAVSIRREFISQMSANSAIFDLPYEHMEYEKMLGACCENVIGYTQIPVGIVGPLIVNETPYYVTMATTEGALVASTNRGCKALSNGVQVLVEDCGMTRAPALKFPDIRQASVFCQWFECQGNIELLQKLIERRSRFTKLVSIKTSMAGHYVFLRFQATTGDAMGMNMLSQAVEECLGFLKNEFTSMRIITVSGNMCTDKKPSAVNWILGRGKKVVAHAEVPKTIVQSVLKTQVKDLVELNQVKNLIGSSMAGSIGGLNAHAANIVTAIFIATGQDPAQNVESSNCLTILEETDSGNLAISCTLPSLEVGTLGGGTILPAQKAALRMLGVQGASKADVEINDNVYSNAKQLAAIIGACVVAGELSLLSALSTGDLVKSHLKLNRSAAPSVANSNTSTAA